METDIETDTYKLKVKIMLVHVASIGEERTIEMRLN